MDIKLKARLSAYARIESLEGLQTTIPVPNEDDIHSVLGVGTNGKYTLFPKATQDDYNEAFGNSSSSDNRTATKSEIDQLFKNNENPESIEKAAIDKLFEFSEDNVQPVDKPSIDTLFEKDDIDSVNKGQIDSLFTTNNDDNSTPSIGVVSHSAIDSLFT